jgi:suppressor for copper-sensitivity B
MAESGASDWVREKELSARLISASATAGKSETLMLGLELEWLPGWHTYWRSPGDAGMPATIDWAESKGLKNAEISWPAPKRMVSQGIQSIGYEQSPLILPITATLEPGQPLNLRAKADVLVCAELCIPYSFALSLDLPAGAAKPTELAKRIEKWQGRVPAQRPDNLVRAEASRDALLVYLKTDLKDPDILVESAKGYRFSAPQFLGNDGSVYSYKLPLSSTLAADKKLAGHDYRFTVLSATENYEFQVDQIPEATAALPAHSPEHRINLAYALLIALVGGLILNLMPCVLPVLSLKVLSIASHAGAPPSHIRLSFLANAAGIITSFLVLAAIAISLKQTGVSFGWGVQFQHPAFVIPMVIVLTLFAASLWNFIQIPLPRFVADAINDNLPTGTDGHDRTLAGNFLTGAFATLLATPCSAPFVGTAIGFALTGTTLDIILIALAMGLGLATPYLLIAAFPAIAHHLPKPGRWMEWLKLALGAALLVTALWLASVLGPQIGQKTAGMVGGGVLLAMLALWIRASIARPILFLKGLGVLALLAAISIGIASLPQSKSTTPLLWANFDESKIPELVRQGNVVLVDVTAEWCLTCKVNKRLVLEAEPTRTLLGNTGLVLMQADWTARDDKIGAYLAKHGRYGIPFNMVYGPKAPNGVALPELLTAARVEQGLKEAGLALDD